MPLLLQIISYSYIYVYYNEKCGETKLKYKILIILTYRNSGEDLTMKLEDLLS